MLCTQPALLLLLLLCFCSMETTTSSFFGRDLPKPGKKAVRAEEISKGGKDKDKDKSATSASAPTPDADEAAEAGSGAKEADPQDLSPYQQHLPECTSSYPVVKKVTDKKAILCPMFRDEQGFLAEWIAYYKSKEKAMGICMCMCMCVCMRMCIWRCV